MLGQFFLGDLAQVPRHPLFAGPSPLPSTLKGRRPWVVAVDTCVPCSMLAFRLAPPLALIDTFPKLIYW